jgi:CPA2 family monovalent cation:H+ antiporter-2
VAVIVGNVVAVTAGTFLTGFGTRTSIQAGMSLSQIGEFSFIIAGVGLSSGATRPFLYPIAIAVSAITTLTTPWLIRASKPVAIYVDRKLPKPLQTFVSLYASWIERLRATPAGASERSETRRLTRLLLIDAALLTAIVVATALEIDRVVPIVTASTTLSPATARIALFVAAGILAAPLVVGLIRTAYFLSVTLATRALPATAATTIDYAGAPRKALVVTLQVAILAFLGIPLIAMTQPLFHSFRSGAALFIIFAILSIAFWRSATNLHGHAKAGAEVIVSTLAQQMAPTDDDDSTTTLDSVRQTLPGLGEPVRVRIRSSSLADGRTLAQLNLRGMTGATVLAITRGDERVTLPVGREVLHAGDILALAGTQEAVDSAVELLRTPV